MSNFIINSYQFAAADWTPAEITTTLWLDANDISTIVLKPIPKTAEIMDDDLIHYI